MNNTSKYYQRLTNIQIRCPMTSASKLFMEMRDLVDEAEQFQSTEIAELVARVAELDHQLMQYGSLFIEPTDENKIKADAIREAANALCWYRGLSNTVDADELNEYADKLEKGE